MNHGFVFNWSSAWGGLVPTPLALAALLLTLVSLLSWWPKARPLLRGVIALNWGIFAWGALSGLLLQLGGGRVRSSYAASEDYQLEKCGHVADLSYYCLPADAARHGEHLMYVFFVGLSLVLMGLLLNNKLPALPLSERWRALLMPSVAFFMYGCAYMVGRVAFLPGHSPGT